MSDLSTNIVCVDNDFARLSYEASLRSLDKQEGLLDELRARAGLLIAASSLAASFLGQPALAHAGTALVVLALLAFALSVGSSLYVLMPKRGLVFSLAGSVLYEGLFDFRDDMAEVYRRVTYELDQLLGVERREVAAAVSCLQSCGHCARRRSCPTTGFRSR